MKKGLSNRWQMPCILVEPMLPTLTHFLGVQQSPAAAFILPASSLVTSLGASGSSSPKSWAMASQAAAMVMSFSDSPRGLCVVQRTKAVL